MNASVPILSERRIPALDGLRGLAVALVLVWHYFASRLEVPLGSVVSYAGALFRLGWSGVDLFFVLSGFLIGGILLDSRDSPNYYRTFFLRRGLRILPAYFALLVVWLVGGALASPAFQSLFANPVPSWSYFLFLQNFFQAFSANSLGCDALAPTWSLAIEQQFYLTAPLLMRWLPRRALPAGLLAVIIGAGVFRLYLNTRFPDLTYAGYVLTPARADTLAWGVLAAALVREPAVVEILRRWSAELVAGLIALGAALGWVTVRQLASLTAAQATLAFSALAAFYFLTLLLIVLHPGSAISSVFCAPVLRWLGKVSYAVYLFHQPVRYTMQELLGLPPHLRNWADAGWTLLALAVTLLLAQFSWDRLEKFFVKKGHSFQY